MKRNIIYTILIIASIIMFSGCTDDETTTNSHGTVTLYDTNSLVDPSVPIYVVATYDMNITFETFSTVIISSAGDLNPNNYTYVGGVFNWTTEISDIGTHTIVLSDGNNTQDIVFNIGGILESSDDLLSIGGGLSFSSSGDGAWYSDSSTYANGNSSVRSYGIIRNQETCIQTSINGIGELTFKTKVSSESGYDYLRFYVDDSFESSYSISGSVDWKNNTYDQYYTGVHTYKWCYKKDSSGDTGSDAAWLDSVVFTK